MVYAHLLMADAHMLSFFFLRWGGGRGEKVWRLLKHFRVVLEGQLVRLVTLEVYISLALSKFHVGSTHISLG